MLGRSIKNGKDFLGLFYKPDINSHELTKKTKISLYILRIDGGRFDYESMYKQLGNASISYVLSRVDFNNISEDKLHEAYRKVKTSFRNSEVNNGEGGELFLYCFLETDLNAPKILSKMELKTSGNDYVKGSDGIHILDLGEGKYHLIFGESKMFGDSTKKGSSFGKAIQKAFESIKKFEKEGIEREINLIDSNLMKETYNSETIDFLKQIIKPSVSNNKIKKMNAFGIFVGFEIDINDWDLQNMDDTEFEKNIKQEVKNKVEESYDYITKQIQGNNLSGYHFYIYAVPFIKNGDACIEETRKKIIEYI
jgi:uncharacterized protein YeeX (DUF496 family)